jgi:Coenzyme PQQ synthesis protein D (PqqD)
MQQPLSNSMHLSVDSVVSRKMGIIEAEIEGEVVALNIETGTCYGLNQVGSRIWHMLSTSTRISDICEALLAEYSVGSDDCERQVLDLLEDLYTEGLIAPIEEK